ncbi:dsDNA nuclease domain-containing protein [Amycolatopsis pigmentata]|uniref:DsDNA nuclease domain-containing protein n=1 Tax=Amycolatopsis pigmentata TaxID=450801 RepID=A0ABW5FJE0_9PSEU
MGKTAAADGGRRSRRGFAYQDVATLLDCLDMHDGQFEEVGFEDDDDIVCTCNGHTIYRQVKTSERGHRHSIATICRPEVNGRVETSILGRLFSGKPVTSGTRFCLLLNETPQPGLAAFVANRGTTRGVVPTEHCLAIQTKLQGLALPDGATISWCLDRFEVLVEARTIEQIEGTVLKRLQKPAEAILGQPPLAAELDDVLARLLGLVAREAAREAMDMTERRWSPDQFSEFLHHALAQSTGRRADGSIEPLQTLASKLRPAGVPAAEAKGHVDQMLDYRRRYRAALGGERTRFDVLNDHIFTVCTTISAKRRAGIIRDGPPAYAATVEAATAVELPPQYAVTVADKLAALSDVTARCQNRYTDA